ncbi:angiopoietin-related protein 7-like [Drosophila albomicans]|uniref:Angiopoietin-related protein 7-like n=1 Tax=Drosophila albomicans TaxID=7291 RepID=A0A6P8WRA3_DROAB|nr:angiopoietin-related protein 7-like [Drosophila albomicans]
MEQQCRSYTYSVVKPMLDYLRQVSEDLMESESKDRIIKDLREKLVQQEINEALIKELRSQIDFQKRIDSILTDSNEKCKDELASKSAELDRLNVEIKKLNSSLLDKDKEIAKINISDKSELKEPKKNIQTTDNSLQFSEKLQSQIDLLKQQLFEECKMNSAEKFNKLENCEHEFKKINSSPNKKDESVANNQKTVELQTEASQNKSEIIKLNNKIPSSCIPYVQGVHEISFDDLGSFDVLCDSQLVGPGAIVIQQRVGGDEDFNRDWATYREGFGSMQSDFFLGLEKIHRLTSSRPHELYVHLVALNGTAYYAHYDDFQIANERNGYRLRLGKYNGNASTDDCLRRHRSMKFSTYDRDNDVGYNYSCALNNHSGWWFEHCYQCNLNVRNGRELKWYSIDLKEVKMLIRPKQ